MAVGDARGKGPLIAPLALFAKGTKVGGEAVAVAAGAIHRSGPVSVSVTVAQVREASALWGLVLLDASPPAKSDTVAATPQAVPLRLGAWLEKPAGLDAVEIVEPLDVPIGATVVDDKKRFVGIVARVPGHKNPVLIRERTLRLFASGSVATDVAPTMPATPLALVVNDARVTDKMAQREGSLKRSGPRLASGAAEFSALPPELRADAAASLLQGGFSLGDSDSKLSLAVVLPAGGVALTRAIDRVEKAITGFSSLHLVVHILPSDLGTQAQARALASYCILQASSEASWADFRRAMEGAKPAPEGCDREGAKSFLSAEMLLLRRLDIDEPLAAAGSTVASLTEPAAVLHAMIGAGIGAGIGSGNEPGTEAGSGVPAR